MEESDEVWEQFTHRLYCLRENTDDTMVYCGHNGIKCNNWYMRKFWVVNHLTCCTYNTMEGKPKAETFTQGIENGVTFIFMTGSSLIASKYDTWTIPGFRNTFHTSSGSDGIRLIIHSPDMGPMPNLDGIDVSPGMDTTIGITSKEDIRLPHP